MCYFKSPSLWQSVKCSSRKQYKVISVGFLCNKITFFLYNNYHFFLYKLFIFSEGGYFEVKKVPYKTFTHQFLASMDTSWPSFFITITIAK